MNDSIKSLGNIGRNAIEEPAKQVSPLEEAVAVLSKMMSTLEDSITELEDRLDPIMSPPQTANEKTPIAPTFVCSKVLENVLHKQQHTSDAITRICEIMKRLDI